MPAILQYPPRGEPAQSVGCAATLGGPFQEREPWIEEEVELLHSSLKETSHRIVPQLVNEDKDRERKKQLKDPNCYIHFIEVGDYFYCFVSHSVARQRASWSVAASTERS